MGPTRAEQWNNYTIKFIWKIWNCRPATEGHADEVPANFSRSSLRCAMLLERLFDGAHLRGPHIQIFQALSGSLPFLLRYASEQNFSLEPVTWPTHAYTWIPWHSLDWLIKRGYARSGWIWTHSRCGLCWNFTPWQPTAQPLFRFDSARMMK